MTDDHIAREVLQRYPAIWKDHDLKSLGNRGGFSGARLWRVRAGEREFCLRAWPPTDSTPERIAWIHRLMTVARAADLSFVPAVVPAADGSSCIQTAGRLWDLTSWLPGRANFDDRRTEARLRSACVALSRLHAAWVGIGSSTGPCPAVQRRLERAREWAAWIRSGWQPAFGQGDDGPVRPWAERAWRLLRNWVDWVPRALATWRDRPLTLQPCLCDIWHDHVLFDGDSVVGVVDYGGVKIDHVAVDLARLLGSMIGDDWYWRDVGMKAYASVRSLSWEEQALVPVLDETGTIIGMANWLRWVYKDGRRFDDLDTVADRLATLVNRVEGWQPPSC